jgi:hypothetical protein
VSFIQNLFTSRDNQTSEVDSQTGNIGNTYVGQQDRLWWNPDTNAFYYSNGNTPGGIPVGGGGGAGNPAAPVNSLQFNNGGVFGGSANLIFTGTVVSVVGNVVATNFLGNGSQLTGLPLTPPGGSNTQVQYNSNNTFAGDPNFTWNAATSTLTVTNINSNTIIGGAGGSNTQVLFNDSGNIAGNSHFTYNKVSGNLTMTGTAYLGNVYPTANNISNIGTPTDRFNDLWLGSGNINLIDNTLNINQQINAVNGNLEITGGNGLVFGQFAMYGNNITIANGASNINIGKVGSTGYVNIERPMAVNAVGGGFPVFIVEQTGTVSIRSYGNIVSNAAALLINGTASGNNQPRNFEGTLIQATAQANTPARMSSDAFGVDGTGQNAYVAWAARVARGSVDAPSQTLAGDTMFRFTSQGWSNSGAYIPSVVRYNQMALENFATGAAGTRHNFQATPVGSATIKNIANIDANGVTFSSVAAGGPANIGITFQDGSYQNTAYLPSSVVRSLTAGSGIGLSASTGNITIQNTGVLGVTGTTNQINVSNVGNVLTLSLPQNLNTTANIQLNQLTVNDLIILGNVSNTIPTTVNGPVIYVANTATTYAGINNSGLSTGNIANNYYASILYNTSSNTWNMSIGNSTGITSGNVYANNVVANANLHLGNAYNNYDFPNALLQGDVNIDSYAQYVLKNYSQTANASTDIVAVNNAGDDGNNYIDMGINSNVYSNVDYAVTGANDGYLYVNGGNLVIGTQTAGKVLNFFTGGTDNLNKIRGTLNDTGLSMVGNVTANNMISTSATIGGTVSATGNITGGNLNIPAGIISASGNIYSLNINTGIVSATGNITGANLRTGGSLSATGNITSGNLLTLGLISSAGNINAANISAGNITSAIISATGNISGPNIIATILSVSAILSVTGNINGGNFLTSGLISTTGNVTANYFLGDGGQLSNIVAVQAAKIANGTSQINIPLANGNANITIGGTSNVVVFSTTGEYITGLLSASGNILSSGNVSGSNFLTGGLISSTGNITSAANISGSNFLTNGLVSAGGTVTGSSLLGSVVSVTANVTGGNLLTGGVVSATANVTGGNLITGGLISAAGNIISAANVSGGNLKTGGLISATGNVTGNYFIGNGSSLTSLTGANVTGTVANATYAVSAGSATTATTAGTVTTNAQPNITSVGILTSVSVTANVTGGNILTGGIVSATANVTGGNLIGQNLTAGRVAIVGSGKQVADDAEFTYNSTTNVLSVAGNVNASYFNGNVVSTGIISTTANVIGGNILTGGLISATGNITGNWLIASNGNTLIDNGVSTTGNVTGNYFIGNGSQLTDVITSITPTALSSTVHVAAVTTGTVANIISDATTANTANTIVLRDQYGAINVNAWAVNTKLTATNYTATTTDYWIGCTTKGLTITLPNAANGAYNGRQYQIADTVHSGNPGDTVTAQSPATVSGNNGITQQGQIVLATYINGNWYLN